MERPDLLSVLRELPESVLADGFCLLYEKLQSSSEDRSTAREPDAKFTFKSTPSSFTDLIILLKQNYEFPELGDFVIEGDRVYFRGGGKNICLSRDRVARPSAGKTQGGGMWAGNRFENLEMGNEK